jgi:hypothetical protein
LRSLVCTCDWFDKVDKVEFRSVGILTENSVRNIDAIREMEALKHEYQVRCSHFELQYSRGDNSISCSICSKRWLFHEKRGFQNTLQIYTAERDRIEQ